MIELSEGLFIYRFPDGWEAKKWDETTFHTKHFQSFGEGSKAAEFVAFESDKNELWLIECKDFRTNGRSKKTELCDEIAEKFKATLAALVCARNSDISEIRRFSRIGLKKTKLRCILHWEHPIKPHRLWPSSNMDRANMRQKLRQRLNVADPLAELGNKAQLNALMPWTILDKP